MFLDKEDPFMDKLIPVGFQAPEINLDICTTLDKFMEESKEI